MRKNKIIPTIACILITSKFFAQIEKYKPYYFNDLPNSPTTSTFLRYGNIQNSEYTGANSPTIQLITIKEGDITIPINLNYISGNGVKVRDEASSVGLGWGIPLATITQTVWGGYDDFSPYNKLNFNFLYDSTPPFLRNPFTACENSQIPSQYLNQLGYDKMTYYKSMRAMLPIGGYFKDYNLGLNEYDTSPDIFICNLFGEKLEFVTKNFTTHLFPFNPSFIPTFECINKKGYKIDYNTNDLFIITNPSGVKYYFSKSEEYGGGFYNSSGTLIINPIQGRNFVVTKIIDKNNRTIIIDYDENLNVKLIPNYTQNLNLTLSYNSFVHADNYFSPNVIYSGSCSPATGYGNQYLGEFENNLTYQPYASSQVVGNYRIPIPINGGPIHKNLLLVKSVSGNFGKINFQYSNRVDFSSNKLDQILVKNSSNQNVKKINFNYSYFNSQNSLTTRSEANTLLINPLGTGASLPLDYFTKRLKLNSLAINDTENYYFEYNSTLLPDKDSFAVDYWGYFNGNTNNKTLFPNPTDFDFTINGGTNVPLDNINNNSKQANLNFAKAGILEKITYPTKGYSIFSYELNTADNLFKTDFPTSINTGNGVRLKNQVNKDSNDNVLSETDLEYTGGKALNSLDIFKKYNFKLITSPTPGSNMNIYTTHSFITLSMLASSDRSISPLSSGDGIGYSIVTKKEIANNSAKGKIVTYYYNNPDEEYQFKDDNVPVFFPIMRSKNNPDNGLVSRIKIYDNLNNILRETENEYYTYSLSTLFYGSSLLLYGSNAYTNGCVIPSLCVKEGIYYPEIIPNPISTFSFYPIFSKESFLKTSKTTDYLQGKQLINREDYTYDTYNLLQQKSIYTPNGNNISETYGYSNSIDRLKLVNILSDNINKTVFKNGRQIFNQVVKFDNDNHPNPTSVLLYKLSDINNNPSSEVTYDQYDSKGNLLQYTTKDGISTAIIWGYNNTQPIAKVEGATYTQISSLASAIINASNVDASAAPNNDETSFLNLLDTFRKDSSLSNYQITTYTYDPLIGVRSITPPSGIREVYLYDSANRLKEIREDNATGKILKEFKYNYKP